MAAVAYRFKAEVRARRRSMLVIAVLLGLGGGAVMAAAAGARRTDTAYPRFVEQMAGADLVIGAEAEGPPGMSAEDALADPAVEAVRPYRLYLTLMGPIERCNIDSCAVGVAGGAPRGGPVDGMKLVEGRLPDPADPSHVALTVVGAEQLDLAVGDTFPLRGVPFGDIFEEFRQRVERQPLTMEVVAIVATPGDFPPQVGDETVQLRFTEAFYDRYPEPSFGIVDALAVRLARGADDVAPFLRRVFAAHPNTIPSERRAQDLNVQRSFHLQALALWALAGVAGLTLLLVVSQAIARELLLGSDDNTRLAAVGMTRAQALLLGLARAGVIAAAGTALAVPVAVAFSPALPRGLARAAEPSPGVAVDGPVLGLGAAGMLVLMLVLAAWPAWRAARARSGATSPGRPRTSASAELSARLGAPPAIVAGVRLALEQGRGRGALPVRTTVAGVTLGLVAIAATMSFGSSLDHLIATPRLYGVSFDMVVGAETVDFRERAGELRAMPEIEGIAWVFDVGVLAGGKPLGGVMLDTDDPSLEPPIFEGRAPVPAEGIEAVLGVATARRLGVQVGDTFSFEVPDTGQRMEATLVGLGALPTFDDSVALSDGVWFSHAGVSKVIGETLPANKAFLDLAPGIDPDAAFRRIASTLDVSVDEDLWRPEIGTPADLVSFGDVRRLPLVLAALIAAIALGLLAHALYSVINRRARDVAVLKTLGFTRAQTRVAVFSQAWVLAVLAAAVGIPLGVVGGRWLWHGFAGAQGIVSEPIVRSWVMAAIALGVVAMAQVVAILPARAAARARPATVLRTE